MKNSIQFSKSFRFSILFLFVPLWLTAQNISVKGTITDKDGVTLIGVSVVERGTTNGTASDMDGNYSLSVASSATLEFSYVGYVKQSLAVQGKTRMDVVLEEDTKALEEVVVIGYGTARRSDVTGAISSIGGNALREVPSGNITQAIQGRIAGVQMEQNSSRPGQAMEIRIRGTRSLTASNDPLIVLDGIPFAGSLSDINPNDIKSIDILKDASSTAIYGSRGANGVIIISTNKGATSSAKPVITYNGYYGVRNVFSKYPMMDGPEFVAYRAEANKNNSNKYPNGPDEDDSVNTDWQELIYQTGQVSSNDVGISNTTQGGGFFNFGAGYYNETTVLPGQDYSRYSLRGSFDQPLGKRVKVGIITQNAYSITGGESSNPLGAVLALSPILKPYNEDGSIRERLQPTSIDGTYFNPLLMKSVGDAWKEQTKSFASYNTLYGDVEIFDGFKYHINVGVNYRQSNYGQYRGPETFYNTGTESSAAIRNTHTINWVVENLLYYDKIFAKKHKVGLVAMYSSEQTESNTSRVNATKVAADFLQYYNLGYLKDGGTINVLPDQQPYYKRGLLSYMFRANYAFDDRYMLTATVRSDGASVLAEGHKWHTYPAVSAGWNIRNESFMESVDWLDQLKLRVGYGQTSNQAINPYQTLGGLSNYYYNFGSDLVMGYYITGLPNSTLGWEYSSTWNYGLDFSLLNSRLRGTVEYYVQNTNKLLLSQALPITSGVSSYIANVGSTENKGFELTLNGQILKDYNGWNWEAGFNLYTNKNKITSLASGEEKNEGNGWFVGQPIDAIFDYKKIGIWQIGEDPTPYEGPNGEVGMIKVEYTGEYDANGNPVRQINADDRQVLGTTNPDFQGGFNTMVSYKNFDLSVIGSFRSGGLLISSLHSHTSYKNRLSGRGGQIMVDYWTESNPTNAYPKPGAMEYTNNPKYGSTLAYFDGSYGKINTITLGYNFAGEWMKSMGLSKLKLYFTAQNPFVFASPFYSESGLDPQPNSKGREFQDTPGNSVVASRVNIVGFNTPSTRNYILGLNITF
jgi:TonB-linked SusC/RagA family outer membrane protein